MRSCSMFRPISPSIAICSATGSRVPVATRMVPATEASSSMVTPARATPNRGAVGARSNRWSGGCRAAACGGRGDAGCGARLTLVREASKPPARARWVRALLRKGWRAGSFRRTQGDLVLLLFTPPFLPCPTELVVHTLSRTYSRAPKRCVRNSRYSEIRKSPFCGVRGAAPQEKNEHLPLILSDFQAHNRHTPTTYDDFYFY